MTGGASAFLQTLTDTIGGRVTGTKETRAASELILAELKKGKSLAQVAREKGKSVDGLVKAMVEPFADRLAKAVEAKRLTKQRADAILKRVTDATEKLVQRQFEPRTS